MNRCAKFGIFDFLSDAKSHNLFFAVNYLGDYYNLNCPIDTIHLDCPLLPCQYLELYFVVVFEANLYLPNSVFWVLYKSSYWKMMKVSTLVRLYQFLRSPVEGTWCNLADVILSSFSSTTLVTKKHSRSLPTASISAGSCPYVRRLRSLSVYPARGNLEASRYLS